MRLAGLYLRSRLAGYALAVLLVVALISCAAGLWLLLQPSADSGRSLVPVLLFAPLVVACILGASTHSPFGEMERTVARPLPALRLCHLAGLLLFSAVVLCLGALTWNQEHVALALVRNLAGLSGMALLSAHPLGARLSWGPPFAFVAIIPFVGKGNGGAEGAWWAWIDQPVTHGSSWTIALALLAAGLAAVCLLGARGSAGEAE